MSLTDLLVILVGIVAIGVVNWYFFLAGKSRVRAREAGGGGQEVRIVVAGGYEPAEVEVRRGVPVRLVFERREKTGYSEEVVFPDFGVRKFLPPFEETAVEVRPDEVGRYEFTCGAGMLRGALIVRDREDRGER